MTSNKHQTRMRTGRNDKEKTGKCLIYSTGEMVAFHIQWLSAIRSEEEQTQQLIAAGTSSIMWSARDSTLLRPNCIWYLPTEIRLRHKT